MNQSLSYKETTRERFLKIRSGLSAEQRREKSRAIGRLFINRLLTPSIQTVFTYVNYHSEVETIDLINKIIKKKKKVCVPLVNSAQNQMCAVSIQDTRKDLKPGFKDILEPDLSADSSEIVEYEMLDMVIVPGVVFDRKGGRIGYGGGYYDRYLGRDNKKIVKVGLAFEQHVLEEIATEPHDILMDYIVTETTIYTI